jgi:hypothetical protein
MLTAQSYAIALALYLSAGLLASVLVYRFWLGGQSLLLRRLVLGAMFGLLLAPAYPSAEAETLAPALIVAVFNLLFVGGWSSAKGAFTVLAMAGAFGMVLFAASALVATSRRTH